jgi:hypothetical protein
MAAESDREELQRIYNRLNEINEESKSLYALIENHAVPCDICLDPLGKYRSMLDANKILCDDCDEVEFDLYLDSLNDRELPDGL